MNKIKEQEKTCNFIKIYNSLNYSEDLLKKVVG